MGRPGAGVAVRQASTGALEDSPRHVMEMLGGINLLGVVILHTRLDSVSSAIQLPSNPLSA
jgi:hypothetical protein